MFAHASRWHHFWAHGVSEAPLGSARTSLREPSWGVVSAAGLSEEAKQKGRGLFDLSLPPQLWQSLALQPRDLLPPDFQTKGKAIHEVPRGEGFPALCTSGHIHSFFPEALSSLQRYTQVF